MYTIKTVAMLMLAASLGTGVTLLPDAAVARGNDHQGHSDHQEHHGTQGGNANRSPAPQATHISGSGKKSERKTRASASGAAGAVVYGGKPPRTPEAAASLSKTPASAGTSSKGPAAATTPPATTAASVITGGTPPRSPAPAATPSAAVVSNGQVKLNIPNSPSGLTVTSNQAGTITVSNGDPAHSVTLPGGSVTISGGVNSVAGASGVQLVSHPNGDFVAVATTKSTPPPPPTVTVTGGPEGGFFHALGSGIEDVFDPQFKATAINPPPATSTSIQR